MKPTKRQHVTKSGDTWEWEETLEFKQALAKYWETVKRHQYNV